MKIYFIALLTLSLAACSSKTKNSGASSSKENKGLVSEISQERKSVTAPKGSNVSAVEDNLKAIESEKDSKPENELYKNLSQAIQSNNRNEVRKIGSQLLTNNPKDIKTLNALGNFYLNQGQFDLAYYLYEKALTESPTDHVLNNNMGVLLIKRGEMNKAIKYIRKSLELDSSDPIPAANLGSIFSQEKDYEKAVTAYEFAYGKGMRDIKILNNYAVSLVALKKFDKAENLYQEILKQQPQNREGLFNMSILYIVHLKKYDQGLESINKLKLLGGLEDSRSVINTLEKTAKSVLKYE